MGMLGGLELLLSPRPSASSPFTPRRRRFSLSLSLSLSVPLLMAGLAAGLGARPSAAFEATCFRPLASPVRSGTDTPSHYTPPLSLLASGMPCHC